MLAAAYCTSKSVKRILDKTPNHLKDILTATDIDGRTPLMYAAGNGRQQSVRTILDNTPQHLKKTVLTAKDKWGDTPLVHAMHNFGADVHDVIKAILDGTPQDLKKAVLIAKNKYGQTPLMLAAKNKDFESFTTILNNTPADLRNDMLTDTDNVGNTIIMLAARNKHDGSKLVETILDNTPDADAHLLGKNNNGDTPLMIAATVYNHEFITTLLKKTPEGVKKTALIEKDSQGRTPLMLGVGWYSDLKHGGSTYDPPELLIDDIANTAGAIMNGTPQDFLPTVLNEKDNQGRTPVMLALGDYNDAECGSFNRTLKDPAQKIEYIARTVEAIFNSMPPEIKFAVLNERDGKGRTLCWHSKNIVIIFTMIRKQTMSTRSSRRSSMGCLKTWQTPSSTKRTGEDEPFVIC